ncbi:hypothetical protein JCM19241_1131 [Vibrio ishigakensis]|uniref:Uncharacterized protein n=1 Tax=Vibrio ishigakensis TaxID=1481914 RepID=A0A0B8QHY2_9VIBR|nr:hypothetical protein JCM19241_1131 [Vibrio ishigakensis]
MSASTCLYKSATFESLSYYVGAVDQSNTSNNEQDYYLSNQAFIDSSAELNDESVLSNRYDDEFDSHSYIEDVALDSLQDEFTELHEDKNWKDYLSDELKLALQKLDSVSLDVIFHRWLTHEKRAFNLCQKTQSRC